MMLKYIYTAIFIVLLASCKKEKIAPWETPDRYIQFQKKESDTMIFSYLFQPSSVTSYTIKVPLKMIGFLPDKNLDYTVEVIPELTTINPSLYSMSLTNVFRAGFTMDSIPVEIKRDPILKTQSVYLALQLKTNQDMKTGQTEFVRQIVKINDLVFQPKWWNANIVYYYMGVYTDKKFRTFIDVIGTGDLDAVNVNTIYEFVRQFKYYLQAQKEAGTPVLEDDGTDMLSTIAMVG